MPDPPDPASKSPPLTLPAMAAVGMSYTSPSFYGFIRDGSDAEGVFKAAEAGTCHMVTHRIDKVINNGDHRRQPGFLKQNIHA